jgi:hypothetical protein
MLIVGAAGKNSGKTTLACSIIRAFAKVLDIVGLKVSVAREATGQDGRPHRQAEPFLLREEQPGACGTDTARMLDAGARRSFFLHAERDSLEAGFQKFCHLAGNPEAIVCESNSLRSIIHPGIFLMIVPAGETRCKPSCTQTIGLTDRVVRTDGAAFDIDPGEISFSGGVWRLNQRPR